MQPEPDMDTVIRIGWTVTVLAFLVTVVSGVGEYLGWWNLVGEVGLTAGSVITVLVGLGTLLAGAGRQQVGGVRDAVEDNGATLDSVDTKLDKLDRLDVIERALVTEEGETSKLDAVQVELDRQTGVLDRQVALLGEIRDGVREA